MADSSQNTSDSTVVRGNATTLLYVATPRPFLGAPRPTWVFVDIATMLIILAFTSVEILTPFYLVVIIPIHIIGVALRARTPHIHYLASAYIGQPRASWRGRRWRKPRAPKAKGLLEG